MQYRALCGLLYGLALVAAVAAAQDESIAEQEQDAIQSYLGFIFESLESHKHYPRAAERRGLSGHVVLRFTVRWDGEVLNPEVVKVTGHDSFGDAAKQALKRVGQLPPFPSDIRRRELLVEVPINYRIVDRSSPGMAAAKYELVVQLLRRAEQGDVEAQFNLGLMSLSGKGVPQNYIEAANWYRKAAEQGHAEAQNSLGEIYAKGIGVPQDDAEAVKWFRKAAEQGPVWAHKLGLRYATGWDVPEDDTEAVKWYRKAAEQGDALAQFDLGSRYENGVGVPQNDVQAYAWFNIAVAQGDIEFRLREYAAKARDRVAERMTREELSRAQSLAQEYWETYVVPFRN